MKRVAIPVNTTELCSYGCGNVAQYRNGSGNLMCKPRHNSCPANRKKNTGGAGIDGKERYNDMLTESKDSMAWSRGKVLMTVEEVFADGKEWGSSLLRNYLHYYELKEYCCSECGITEWQGQHLTLELDHIDGRRNNNSLENLRWLCPNCHSQTPTFRGYNKSLTGKVKVTDQELLTALQECSSIRKALEKVGLAAKGGNYERAKKLNARVVKSGQTQ